MLFPLPKKSPANLLALVAVAPTTVVNPEYSVAPLNANLLEVAPNALLPVSIFSPVIVPACILAALIYPV